MLGSSVIWIRFMGKEVKIYESVGERKIMNGLNGEDTLFVVIARVAKLQQICFNSGKNYSAEINNNNNCADKAATLFYTSLCSGLSHSSPEVRLIVRGCQKNGKSTKICIKCNPTMAGFLHFPFGFNSQFSLASYSHMFVVCSSLY